MTIFSIILALVAISLGWMSLKYAGEARSLRLCAEVNDLTSQVERDFGQPHAAHSEKERARRFRIRMNESRSLAWGMGGAAVCVALLATIIAFH